MAAGRSARGAELRRDPLDDRQPVLGRQGRPRLDHEGQERVSAAGRAGVRRRGGGIRGKCAAFCAAWNDVRRFPR